MVREESLLSCRLRGIWQPSFGLVDCDEHGIYFYTSAGKDHSESLSATQEADLAEIRHSISIDIAIAGPLRLKVVYCPYL
jgi:hypothetical protein